MLINNAPKWIKQIKKENAFKKKLFQYRKLPDELSWINVI
jgi:hypothetical protein